MDKETLELVKTLRTETGASMALCKEAITLNNNDIEKAMDHIRAKGQVLSKLRDSKETPHGIAIAEISDETGIILVVVCETESVTQNDKFVDFVNKVVKYTLENNPVNLEEITAYFKTELDELIAVIGEKIDIIHYARMEEEHLGVYNHHNKRSATLVSFNKKLDEDVVKNIAMQIASMKPLFVDIKDIPEIVSDKEWDIAETKTKEDQPDAPADRVQQITKGRHLKALNQLTLMQQTYIKASAMVDPAKEALKGDTDENPLSTTERADFNKRKEITTVASYLNYIDPNAKVLQFRSFEIS